MKFYTNLNLLICLCLLSILGCSDENRLTSSAQNYGSDGLFAPAAQETVVTFQALYLTHFKTLEEYKAVQVGYNLGPVGVAAAYSEVQDVAGTPDQDAKQLSIRLSTKF
jgi:hypothetical protein